MPRSSLFLLIILVSLAALYFPPSLSQIRPEELSESVREVLWQSHGKYIPGTTVLAGFYLPLQILYRLFGFNFIIVKIFRLSLHIVSLICLAKLLKKSYIPLLTIALSPTLLFFNTLGVPYGIDLQYLPILIFLLPHPIFFWIVFSIAINSYGGFINFVPALVIAYFFIHRNRGLLPLLTIPLVYFTLFFQYRTFPPAAPAGSMSFTPTRALASVRGLIDLPDRYYYEVKFPDFSHYFPLIPLFIAGVIVLKNGRHKNIAFLALLTIAINLATLTMFSSSTGPVDVRRAMGVLAGSYTIYALAWLVPRKPVLTALLLLLPLHHLLVYLPNYKNLTAPSPNREEFWFHRFGSPANSLKKYTGRLTESDLKLKMIYPDMNFIYTYGWAYSTLTANCFYNRLPCKDIYAFDPQKQDFVHLDFSTINKFLSEYNSGHAK